METQREHTEETTTTSMWTDDCQDRDTELFRRQHELFYILDHARLLYRASLVGARQNSGWAIDQPTERVNPERARFIFIEEMVSIILCPSYTADSIAKSLRKLGMEINIDIRPPRPMHDHRQGHLLRELRDTIMEIERRIDRAPASARGENLLPYIDRTDIITWMYQSMLNGSWMPDGDTTLEVAGDFICQYPISVRRLSNNQATHRIRQRATSGGCLVSARLLVVIVTTDYAQHTAERYSLRHHRIFTMQLSSP